MRQVLVDADRTAVADLHAALLAAYPGLPPGIVLGAVVRVRRDLARLGHCEGLWEAVELGARARLDETVARRAAGGRS